jgi:RNA polymerase sigma factor (sigma-70 family)
MSYAGRVPGSGAAVATGPGAGRVSDGGLLERFIAARDAEAFRALIHHHGPMVLGVCRRVLHHEQDAEDAFQATFLVLVRKAASIAKRPSLGSWLYGVAYRVSMKAKMRAQRRRAHERLAVNKSTQDGHEEVLWRDLKPVLDEEIHRLPERYRAPIVLCYLEGRPYAEAAEQLGCSKGTIAQRLVEGRERLRERLTRRGVALSVALFPDALSPDKVTFPVSDQLAETTARVALRWLTSGLAALEALPPSVAVLTQVGLAPAVWTKLSLALACILAVAVAGTSTGLILHGALGDRGATDESGATSSKKGRKTLSDRLEGLPTKPRGTR